MSIDNCQVCERRVDTDFIEYQEDGTLLCDACLDEMEHEAIEAAFDAVYDQHGNPVPEQGFTVEQQSSNRFTATSTSGTWISTDLGGTAWVSTELERMTIERDKYKALAGGLAEALKGVQTGDCWCGAGIGDPRLVSHTHNCKQARAALAKYEQEKGV
jgi:hypothetical protein